MQGLYCGCFVGQGLNLDFSCVRVYLSLIIIKNRYNVLMKNHF